MVFKRTGHLVNSTGDLFIKAQDWAQAESIQLPGPVYEVLYANNTGSDLGQIRIFIPQSSAANEQEVIAWAKTLPPLLAPFFAKRSTAITLPEFKSGAAEPVK